MASRRAFTQLNSLKRTTVPSLRTTSNTVTTVPTFHAYRRAIPAAASKAYAQPFCLRWNSSNASPTSDSKSTTPDPKKIYTFDDVRKIASNPSPSTPLLLDVRTPPEYTTGHIPTALNIDLKSHGDFPFLPASEFEERFGFPKPQPGEPVVFYCKAGVRSRAAANLARQAGWGEGVGEYVGSWDDWSGKGGEVEK